jgi:hypothetical protein
MAAIALLYEIYSGANQMIKKHIFFAFFCLILFSLVLCSFADAPLSDRIASYKISVKLDPEKKMLFGHETIHFRNDSNDELNQLYLHLYWNAFRNKDTSTMKEAPGTARRLKKDNGWGWVDIKTLKLVDGTDLMKAMKIDDSVMKIDLPQPLLPQQTLELNLDFESKIPKGAPRAGYVGNFYFIVQWFPKMGVYIDGAWNCHQYHMPGEFFADFGVYDVDITVPQNYIVGSSGYPVREVANSDGTKTATSHAEDIHDYAWTASPDMLVAKDNYKKAEIMLYYQPCHADQVQRHISALKIAMKRFEELCGPYPYPRISVVDPPRRSTAGGMEYPTLVTAGTNWAMNQIAPKIKLLELVVIHEFGHNYWYGMVANNEFEEAWLDEGINSYFEMKIMDEAYGADRSFLEFMGMKAGDQCQRRISYILSPDTDPIVKYSWEFYPGSYGALTYSKAALALRTLERYLGTETMENITRTYFQRFKFKHPKTADFIQVANEVSGQDLNWFFNQVLYGSDVLDYSISQLSSSEKEDNNNKDKNKKEIYINKVWVRRLGEVIFPVEVEISFDNGEKVREQWDGKERWIMYEYEKPEKLVSATVDPDNKVPLDVNICNNSRTLEPRKKAVNKLLVKCLFWMESLLHIASMMS